MRLTSLVVALLWTVGASAATSAEDARAWIKRMNDALMSQSYDGVLTHKWQDGSESLRLIHRMRDGRMMERVISMDGSGVEIGRNGNQFVRYFPEMRLALVQTRNRSFGHIATLNGLNAETEKFYELRTGGVERLLGWHHRPTQVISIEPRDDKRYGYRFWLDRQNAMPLKTQLITKSGEVIDELSFTQLKLLENIPDELLKPAMNTQKFRWMIKDVAPGAIKQAFAPRANLLPEGYRVLNFDSAATEAQAKTPKTGFIVSDGISWVTVLVEVADKPRPEGLGQMGASATYVLKLDNHYISAVGGVPPKVAKAIAEAVRPE